MAGLVSQGAQPTAAGWGSSRLEQQQPGRVLCVVPHPSPLQQLPHRCCKNKWTSLGNLILSLYRGHASEKPELPEALDETPTGIRFLGPPASAMAALGDKIGSTILAQVRVLACLLQERTCGCWRGWLACRRGCPCCSRRGLLCLLCMHCHV